MGSDRHHANGFSSSLPLYMTMDFASVPWIIPYLSIAVVIFSQPSLFMLMIWRSRATIPTIAILSKGTCTNALSSKTLDHLSTSLVLRSLGCPKDFSGVNVSMPSTSYLKQECSAPSRHPSLWSKTTAFNPTLGVLFLTVYISSPGGTPSLPHHYSP